MVRREKIATLKITDGPGKDASSDSLDFDKTSVSFEVEGEKVRIAATVFGKELKDKPTVRRKFKLWGIILNGEYGGKHFIAYMDLCSRVGTLVILGEPVENGPDWEKIGRQIKDGVDCPATESGDTGDGVDDDGRDLDEDHSHTL